ncbi:MAG: AAA family ATPase [Ardenticatenaceae bacterium]|nr:AAA family ATPase [Ardenticatenaceae bacterium]
MSLETLISYVPGLIVRRLAEKPEPITQATAERFPAAVLFADIVGFTQLAEALTQASNERQGAEQLANLLNTFFTQVIEIITAHGGDVVKFAGDALLALWSAPNKRTGFLFDSERELTQATHQAAYCALALQKQLYPLEIAGHQVAMQIGVSAGHVSAVHIGGVRGRWEFMLSSTPLVQCTHAEEMAGAGQVVLCPDAWKLVKGISGGRPLANNYHHITHITPPESVELPTIPPLTPEAQMMLERYIPAAVLPYLKAGHSEWVAELRLVTVIFMHLPSFGTSIRHPYNRTLPRAQEIMHALQAALYRYEGSINKLNVDDKGITLVAALGLSPLSHEDDPVRGVQAAVEMQMAAWSYGRPSAVGVTTGQLFCGPIGHPQRREYTMVGEAMNMASRLMEAAQAVYNTNRQLPAIYCDETTFQAAQDHLVFDTLPPIRVKGKTQPMAIYRPRLQENTAEQVPPWRRSTNTHGKLIGRATEWEFLNQQISAFRSGHNSAPNLIVLEGEAGIGKSALLHALLARASQLRLYTLATFVTDSAEKTMPFQAWQSLLTQLFSLEPLLMESAQKQRVHILRQFPTGPEERGYPLRALSMAPLLNNLLPLGLPDNELTRPLQGEARLRATHELLLRLLPMMLGKVNGRHPTLFVIDNGHLLDEASMALLLAVQQTVAPVLIIIATRPLPTPANHLLQTAVAHHLRLGPFPHQAIPDLIRQRLGIQQLSPALAEFIQEKGGGHPLYSLALANTMKQTQLLRIVKGEARLLKHARQNGMLPLPSTIQKTVTHALDRLPPTHELLLKRASTLGETFTCYDLQTTYAQTADTHHLPHHLDELVTLGLLHCEHGDTPTYRFPHHLGREAIHSLLISEQRTTLALSNRPR